MESKCKVPEEGGHWTQVRSGKKARGFRGRKGTAVCVPVSVWEGDGEGQKNRVIQESITENSAKKLKFTVAHGQPFDFFSLNFI